MMQESLINNPLLAGIAITLIHFLWQGVLVALVIKLLLSFISYQKSQTRYALAATAMLINLILPLITFFIVYDAEYRQATNFVQALPLLDQNLYLDKMQINAWYIEWFEYLPAISVFWLSIVTLLSIKLVIELYNVNKLPVQGTVKANSELQNRFNKLAKSINLPKKVTLLLSNKTSVPMAIGWLKPVVLIPFSMLSGLTPQQLDMLLLHELAHIRRNDYLVNFLQTLVETLLFFHPAVLWVSKQMRNEREYCSDDIAVQHSDSALAYAHTLADTASLCHKHRQHAIPNMAMAASGGDLKQRVVRLLESEPQCSQTTDSGKWFASITILLVIIFGLSKYSLTLPIIDLQSGSISLSHSPVELNKSSVAYMPLVLENIKTNSSLASQLIAINSTTKNDTNNLTQVLVTAKNDYLANASQKQKMAMRPLTVPAGSTTQSKKASKSYYDEVPIVLSSTQKKDLRQKHSKQISKPTTLTKSIEIPVKSISELAFERTDSKNSSATFSNPYSKQVASLLETPEATHEKLSIKHQTQVSEVNSKRLSKKPFRNIDTRISNSFDDNFVKEIETQPENRLAKLIRSIEPRYPSSAKRKGIELEIMVEFSIDKNGLVKNIKFEPKSKASYFRSAIRNAMEKWRFLPAEKNGLAVESTMSKIFSFSLLN